MDHVVEASSDSVSSWTIMLNVQQKWQQESSIALYHSIALVSKTPLAYLDAVLHTKD